MKKSIIGKVSIICTVLCLSFSCERDGEIVFSQTGVPVDLGLSVKWASCNVGANSPEDYGGYFAWGEVIPKKRYSAANNSYKSYLKILPPYADAAHVNWGGSWRMPTDAELTELCEQCTWTWTTQNGVEGYKVTSKSNGNSIFLPAAGDRRDSSLYGAGRYGSYWSSSLSNNPDDAWGMSFYYLSDVGRGNHPRYYGSTVRPVLDGDLTVTTELVTQITETSAVACGNITCSVPINDDLSVTERGFNIYTYSPTIYNTKIVEGSGIGSFSCNLTNLQPNTTYCVRAYAINSIGIEYGEEIRFTTKQPTFENGYEYIDLGLSVKWATMNVGASSLEDYGDYFAWGETEPVEVYDLSTYKYCNGSSTSLTKYNTNSSYGTVDNKTQLDLSDDAAHVNWGGSWRMPTNAELTELRNNCTWKWTTQNGVKGYKVTSKSNGNSIFLPAAGYRNDSSLKYAGSDGNYWSSSLGQDYPYNARSVYFSSSDVSGNNDRRSDGLSVRPVCP